MFLAINIGNSKISIAIFDGNNLLKIESFDTCKNNPADFYQTLLKKLVGNYVITNCGIISVVNNLDKVIKTACDNVFGINSIILDTDSASEIKIAGPNPKSAGMDRIANVYAIIDKSLPAIVVDIGTAVTFDILSKDKEFIGGIIMSGVNMSLKGLAEGTSKLPNIKAQESPFAIGNNTETCILSGVIRGTACAIDGLLDQCIEELGECKNIILTGGQADLISKYMKHPFNTMDKNLTMFGIKKIYEQY